MSKEFTNVTFVKVDVDANDATAAACGVNCMPTFKFFVSGQEVHKIEGADEAGLRKKLAELN